jgi:hypothetical protein
MPKTVNIELSDEEHMDFKAACKKSGVFRGRFAKDAILEKVKKVNGGKEDE